MIDNSDIWFRRFCHGVLAVVVIVVFLAVCQAGYGQVAKCGAPVSQQCTPRGCTQVTSWGTCVCIAVKDGRRYFLTSGHNITNNGFYICSGGWIEARVDAYTQTPDLALVSIPDNGQGEIYSLYSWQANKGTEVMFVGYPNYSPRAAVVRKGSILGYANPYYVDAAIRVEHGDSGGPLLLDGRTVGVVFGKMKSGFATAIDSETCIAWLNSRGFNFGMNQLPDPHPGTPPDRTPPALPSDPGALLQIQAQIAELRVLIESGQLRGPAGKDGIDGKQGPAGPPGKDGRDGITPDLTAVESRIASLEARIKSLSENSFIDVRWVNRDGSNPTETRRYRIGQDRIDLYRDQATVKGGEE